MISFDKINEKSIRLSGSHEGVSISGHAYLRSILGANYKCWSYNLVFFCGSKQMKTSTNEKDHTMNNEKRLMERIKKEAESFSLMN